MAKNCLAFFGLIFLTLIIVGAVLAMGVFYDSLGIVKLPDGWVETPMSLLTPAPVKIRTVGAGKATWTNPLVDLPTAALPLVNSQPTDAPTAVPTATPRPRPTATPIPPMDPQDYQIEVMARLKDFAAALESWLDANNRLAQDGSLLNDQAWQTEVKQDVERINSTGRALAAVGPAPAQYRSIDGWLKKSASEATAMRQSYLKALDTGTAKDFQTAGDHFANIKEDLALAVKEMSAAGWTFQ